MNKLVIGKPAAAKDATNGLMDTTTLAGCLKDAKAKNWSAGAMVWEVSIQYLNLWKYSINFFVIVP